MNSIAKEVRTATYNALSAITWNGAAVPVHLVVPDPPTYPYIEIVDVEVDNDSTQTSIEAICTVRLEAVTAWLAGGGSYGAMEAIEDSISVAMAGLQGQVNNHMIIVNFERSSSLKDYDGARVVLRKIIEYRVETQDK